MYVVITSVVPSAAEAEPTFGAYSLGLAVAAKMCKQSVALGEAAKAVAEHIFAIDVGVQVGRGLGGGLKCCQLTTAEVADRIRVSMHLFQYTKLENALLQACLAPLLQ